MANSNPITIKKYANRRLYNTASSAYVTLADLAKMVKAGEDFIVYDAKTNDDITRSVLTQIIFEQEGIEGQSLLPTTFLRQLIRFYGDSMQAILPSYLEFSIDRFSGEQQAMREAASRMFGPEAFSASSFAALQELTKKNFAAFNQTLAMFSPFTGATTALDIAAQEGEFRGRHRPVAQSAVRHAKAAESLAKKTETPKTDPCACGVRQILQPAPLRSSRQRPEPSAPPPAETDWPQVRRQSSLAQSADARPAASRPPETRAFRTGLPGSMVRANRPFASVYSCPQ